MLSPSEVLEGVLSPLMNEVGDMWADGRLSVAHEHAATAVLRLTLSEAVEKMDTERPGAPRILVATPSGQRHDLGALLVAATAASSGCHVSYLGPDLPAMDIAIAARAGAVDLVALSIVHPADDPAIAGELESLRRELPTEIPLLVGGRASSSYRSAADRLDVHWMDDLGELRNYLSELTG